jgi:hypothetical protein
MLRTELARHEQIRDAVGRLYITDPPAVIEERSHQVSLKALLRLSTCSLKGLARLS